MDKLSNQHGCSLFRLIYFEMREDIIAREPVRNLDLTLWHNLLALKEGFEIKELRPVSVIGEL